MKRINPLFTTASLTAAFLAGCAATETPTPAGAPAAGQVPADGVPTEVGHFEANLTSETQYPTRIAVAADGTVFVSDTTAGNVIGTKDGKRTVVLSNMAEPMGLAVFGDRLYVGSKGRGTVEVYSLGERRWLMNLDGGKAFTMPNDVAVADDGTAFVVDSAANVVRAYDADGALVTTLGGEGDGAGQLRFPAAVAVDAQRIVVGDQGNHRLQVWDRHFNFVRSMGEAISEKATSVADFKGRFTRVQGLALHGDDIYVLDSYHSHVQVLSGTGQSKGFLGRGGDCTTCVRLALGIALDAKGQVVATDPELARWVTLTVEAK